jgi:Tfp pilus assembly protein PilN
MIQFNLLPDVKKEYIKARRTKNLIISVAGITSVVAVVIVALLLSYVQVGQKGYIDDLSKDIKSEITSLNNIQDLNKTLTIQNQLDSLPLLHEDKPEASRIFAYLNQITPEQVKIRSVSIDFDGLRMVISGSADSLATINKYSDTLKFATYKAGDDIEGVPFTSVATQLSRNEDQATYEIIMNFEEDLFDNTLDIVIDIPEQITTRSVTGKPSIENNLFEDNPNVEIQ